ncbi:hypothetical protein [Nonomuraea sp. NPDC048916]|uniref:hypothetical protein n=1 Tax=Nonomuraea sp. NPDC048916 TaxID=3154232 RepID=UPI0033D6811C
MPNMGEPGRPPGSPRTGEPGDSSASHLEGLDTAARKGNHGGRPAVIADDDPHRAAAPRGLAKRAGSLDSAPLLLGPQDLPGLVNARILEHAARNAGSGLVGGPGRRPGGRGNHTVSSR